MTAWINSSQAFLLGLLAIGGLVFVARASRWERPQRAEFYLCGWLAAALILHTARSHPHFERYYLFAVPCLGIPACAGLYAAGSRLFLSDRRFWPVALVGMIAFLGLAKSLYEEREATNWYNMEAIADKVREVTPQQGMLLADELTYFLTRHPPPSGMELADSHKLDFPAPRAAELHVISRAELDRQMKSGVFDTIETWEEEDRIVALGLRRLYPHNTEVQQAHIFWH